ncbi:MAG: DinB family protein [Pyrinomonadaceae bacterium]
MNKETLLKQYDRCWNENGWFVAVRNAIEGVTAEQAAWKPEGSDNSIWESLSHVSYYNNAYLQRFKGIDYKYDVADNDETFRGGALSEDEWQTEVAKFDAIMTEWRGLIEASEEAKFDQPISAENSANWGELIANVNAHNAYHGGQILLLRKLQGSWNPDKGVS